MATTKKKPVEEQVVDPKSLEPKPQPEPITNKRIVRPDGRIITHH
jgi:hypothetical protein